MARFGRPFCKTPMMRRAFMVWLAVFALFAQALAPLSAAWAFDAETDYGLQVICSASGAQTIAIGQDGQPIEPMDMAACPFCVLHVSAAVFSPSLAVSLPLHADQPAQAFGLPSADVHASLWRAQPRPPRGPPRTA